MKPCNKREQFYYNPGTQALLCRGCSGYLIDPTPSERDAFPHEEGCPARRGKERP